MKTLKKTAVIMLCAVMTVCIAFCAPVAFADDSGSCGSKLNWSFNSSNGALSITGSGDMTDFKGVQSVPWYSVMNKIKSVNIASGATSIGKLAFFEATALTSVTMPDTLKKIGETAFWNCTKLAEVEIPNGVTEIAMGAFLECSSIKTVTVPASVTKLGKNSFSDCKALTKAIIIGNIEIIDELTFSGDIKLKSVSIPASVTKIEKMAFLGDNSLTDIYYGSVKADWDKISVESYNDPVKNAKKHYSTAPTDVTLNFKSAKKLSASGSGIKWSSSDESVVKVAQDGTVTGAGKGNAVVCAVDSNNMITTFNVTVQYTFIQKIIIYVLFGWIWYK